MVSDLAGAQTGERDGTPAADHALTERPGRLRRELRQLRATLERLPRTLCYRCASPAHLRRRRTPAGREQLVATTWTEVGIGAVGEELAAPILEGPLGEGLHREQVEHSALSGYLAGLEEAGWQGDPWAVRRGYAAAAALRYTLPAAAVLVQASDDGGGAQRPAADADAALARLAFLLDLAQEARVAAP